VSGESQGSAARLTLAIVACFPLCRCRITRWLPRLFAGGDEAIGGIGAKRELRKTFDRPLALDAYWMRVRERGDQSADALTQLQRESRGRWAGELVNVVDRQLVIVA
jgi:hypothetical protein